MIDLLRPTGNDNWPSRYIAIQRRCTLRPRSKIQNRGKLQQINKNITLLCIFVVIKLLIYSHVKDNSLTSLLTLLRHDTVYKKKKKNENSLKFWILNTNVDFLI